jgi:hypothetical protein
MKSPMTLQEFSAEHSSPLLYATRRAYNAARANCARANARLDAARDAYREEILALADAVGVTVTNLRDDMIAHVANRDWRNK